MSSPSGMAIGCRAAVGVASLPGNAPVEIQLVAIIANQA
jgi:enamine deaminase RidA (YjgF/YER057c/UK114 family)